jgi:YD repeat-containing protein
LLQTQQENRSLAAGESYTESLTLALPEVAGTQYLLVLTDAGRAIAEANENNNLGIASQSLAIDVPLLTVGNLVNGEVQQGQWTFVRFAGEPGKTVRINLDSSDDSGILALYTQYATILNAISYEGLAALEQSDQEIRILNLRAGTYYLGIYGQWVSGDATSFTLSASLTQPALHSITQTKVDNSGQATLELVGDNFSAADKIKLVAPDGMSELLPVSVVNQDSTRTYTTFDFQGVNVGTYDVVFENPDLPQPLVLLDALSVTAPVTTGEQHFVADLIVPDRVRPGREVTLTVQYSNPNSTDLLSPLLHLTSDLVLDWQIPGTDRWISGSSIDFLAASTDGSASILAPGDTDSVDLKIRTPFSTGELNFTLYGVGIGENDRSGEAINWDSLKTNSRPPGVSPETWEPIWSNLKSQTGNTWDDFVAMLGDNAAYLARLGQPVGDVGRLLAFELLQASGLNPSVYLTGAQDAFVPVPGLDLNFNRVYARSLLSRYELGALGRGWRHNYEIYLQETDEGNILAYGFDSLPRLFAIDPSGGYDSAAGDRGVLSIDSGGTFSLREADGRLYHFRSDLRLDSIADPNGNNITASYTDGNLTELTHSSGQSLQLEYNGNGRISRLTDAAEGQTTYAYDASGEQLLQAIEPDGRVTTYEYSTSGSELISVTNDAGDRLSYSYDALGHLAGISLNENAGIINYSYDAMGQVTVADATGTQTKLFYDWRGLPLQVSDALGRTYQFEFDAQGNLAQISRPDGLSAEITYDDRMSKTLTNVRYESCAETLQIDDSGNTSQYTNRRGNSIDYSYNNGGLLVRQDYEYGSSVEYVYDNRGNLTAATDAKGSTTLEYDSADRLTKITYPNGRFLEYTYDSVGRRKKMVDQQGFTVNYSYDSAGRLAGLTDRDGMAGFLPPFNEETQYELGWVEFNVKAKADLPTGTEIQNQAFVQFDLVGEFNPAPKPDPLPRLLTPAKAVIPMPSTA